jgi:3-deoxy-D-manno-octulosonic-acid transferase
MMRLVYNTVQLLSAPLFLLALPVLLCRPNKRRRLLQRFGGGLRGVGAYSGRVIWIHALSVGEVSSALPLVRALRSELPHDTIIFSATTTSGCDLAEARVAPFVDNVIAFPIDILPVVRHFIKRIAPDLFILIETDFWPNLLYELSAASVPTVLVNGRISARSMRSYQRFAPLFRPLFNKFDFLCMQTAAAAAAMRQLGVAHDKVRTLGNLKCVAPESAEPPDPRATPALSGRASEQLLILCGSTHPGEEELLLSCGQTLARRHNIHLALAPRRIERSGELLRLASQFGLSATLLTQHSTSGTAVTIIDTIGDLAALYRLADIAFIGGSLVPQGGHNPVEAAREGCPVLFGPHMEDFAEISDELLACQAAFQVRDEKTLLTTLEQLILVPDLRRTAGQRAQEYTRHQGNVIDSHLALIRELL